MSLRDDSVGQRADRPDYPVSPEELIAYRRRLSHGEDTVDPETWAGSLPSAYGIAPRIRVGRDKWLNVLWLIMIGWVLLLIGVAIAQGVREDPGVRDFISRHPGIIPTSPETRPGMPWWVDVQHFVNLVFMLFMIRSGIQVLADHARLYWTRHSTPGSDWFRFQKPIPETRCGLRSRTRSVCRSISGCPVYDTRSGWLTGGTSVWTCCGC